MKTSETELHQIETAKIDFDINNPRGESVEVIMNDDSFNRLASSINEFGIIEPIIIKEKVDSKGRFILVDGERRLRAAKNIKLLTVPALIVNKELDAMILAYHLHMLRKQWDKAAETKSIKRIISEIENDTPGITEIEIKKKIKEITKATANRIKDIYTLIKYEDKYIDLVMMNKLDMSYLIQGQDSFVNKIKNKYPDILDEFPESKIRSIIAEKSYKKLIPSSRFWMDVFKDVFNYDNPNDKTKIKELLIEFLEKKNKTAKQTYDEIIEFLKIKENDIKTQETKKGNNKEEKKDDIKDKKTDIKLSKKPDNESKVDQNNLNYSPIKLDKKQQIKIDDIQPKYESIGTTLTIEEKEYIKEAINCLKNHCFKAAVLMIWATGVSRILFYIQKDIADFNKCSLEMRKKPDSFYKFYSSNFKTDYQKIENISNDSRDMHLICYLCYKQIITVPIFDKLQSNFKTRCNCAHPTSIILEVNETVAIFENIFEYILNNPKLR